MMYVASVISQFTELLQCHPGKMWSSIVMKQNYDQGGRLNALLLYHYLRLEAFNHQNQILKEVIEN